MGESKKYYPPPRKGFVPATDVQWAELSEEPPSFARPTKQTGARAEGLRYERKAHAFLQSTFGDAFIKSPWVKFYSSGKEKYCQPDGVVLLDNRIIIAEIKLSHTGDAWWQLKHLYLPVLEKLFGKDRPFKLLEICKFFDGHTKFPDYFELVDDAQCLHSYYMQVLVWKGK